MKVAITCKLKGYIYSLSHCKWDEGKKNNEVVLTRGTGEIHNCNIEQNYLPQNKSYNGPICWDGMYMCTYNDKIIYTETIIKNNEYNYNWGLMYERIFSDNSSHFSHIIKQNDKYLALGDGMEQGGITYAFSYAWYHLKLVDYTQECLEFSIK
jgi:hypothetical protein